MTRVNPMMTIKELIVEYAVNANTDPLTYDFFKVTGHAAALREAGATLAAKLPQAVTVLVAPGMGAGPLAAAVALSTDRNLVTLTVRDPAKCRNGERLVEGPREPPAAPDGKVYAAFVDDIISNGKTYHRTVETLKTFYPQLEIVCCLLLFNGWSFESRVRVASGVPVYSCLRRHDINLTRDEQSFANEHVRTHLLPKKVLETRIGLMSPDRKKSSPLLLPDRIITADDLHMVRATSLSGDSMWAWSSRHMRGDKGIVQDLKLQPDGTLLIAGYSGALVRLSVDGALLWEDKIAHAVHSTPIVDSDGDIYVNCEEYDSVAQHAGGSIVRLRADGVLVQKHFYSSEFAPATCVLHADTVIVTANDCTVRSFSKADLSECRWQHQIKAMSRGAFTIAGDRLFFGDESGVFYCLNAITGELLWSKQIARAFFAQVPIVFEGKVIMCDSLLNAHALDIGTGVRKWICRFRSAIPHRPTQVLDNLWMFSGRSGDVSLVDIRSGTKVAHTRTNVEIRQPGAYAAGRYAQLTANGFLQLWEVNSEIRS